MIIINKHLKAHLLIARNSNWPKNTHQRDALCFMKSTVVSVSKGSRGTLVWCGVTGGDRL